ncbi:PAAR domain-containing protein [Chitinimonas sp. PSY-7]|uniref:PAAR domain-containing protein n=1 Tax=Chitinimonas sp. PSY-7 TaxID=3459088 RepID=UPI00403FF206
MGKPYILLGDPTSHGGTVLEGSMTTTINGKPVARVGDKVSCPIPGHGTCVIVSGDFTHLIDGKPLARHGDTTACGASLIATQFQVLDHV